MLEKTNRELLEIIIYSNDTDTLEQLLKQTPTNSELTYVLRWCNDTDIRNKAVEQLLKQTPTNRELTYVLEYCNDTDIRNKVGEQLFTDNISDHVNEPKPELFFSIRTVMALNKDEAIEKNQNEDFEDNHPLCDKVLTESDLKEEFKIPNNTISSPNEIVEVHNTNSMNGFITIDAWGANKEGRVVAVVNEITGECYEIDSYLCQSHLVRLVVLETQLNKMNAKEFVRYWGLYKDYLLDNNLDDDSNAISIPDLVNFVNEEIIPNI